MKLLLVLALVALAVAGTHGLTKRSSKKNKNWDWDWGSSSSKGSSREKACDDDPCGDKGSCKTKSSNSKGSSKKSKSKSSYSGSKGTWDNFFCVCKNGFGGPTCQSEQDECRGSGDVHYYNFDGKKFDFQGICYYLLSGTKPGVELDNFQVYVQNEKRNTKPVSYTKYVEIVVRDDVLGVDVKIKLGPGEYAYVNGYATSSGFSYSGGLFTIYKRGRSYRLDTNYGLSVEYDGKSRVTVKIDTKYRNQVEGLCGNDNGDKYDDFVTPDGTSVTDETVFGESWKKPGGDDPTCPPNTEPPPTCDIPESDLVDYCDEIATGDMFKDCRDALAAEFGSNEADDLVQIYFEDCKFDVCAADDPQAEACDARRIFADFCEPFLDGNFIEWYVGDCAVVCENGGTFTKDASACPRTCQNPNGDEECPFPNTYACECPDDRVLDGNTCVKEKDCDDSCYDEYGRRFEKDDQWWNEDCTIRYECKSNGEIEEKDKDCKDDEVCLQVGGIFDCVDIDPCDDDEWTTCKTFSNEDSSDPDNVPEVLCTQQYPVCEVTLVKDGNSELWSSRCIDASLCQGVEKENKNKVCKDADDGVCVTCTTDNDYKDCTKKPCDYCPQGYECDGNNPPCLDECGRCPSGEVCIGGVPPCVPDCDNCPADTVCQFGNPPCIDVCDLCEPGYSCQDGGKTCEPENTCTDDDDCNDAPFTKCALGPNICVNPCQYIKCLFGWECDEALGECVDKCDGVNCPEGLICVDGGCSNPCDDVTCKAYQTCINGQCWDICDLVICPTYHTCSNGECICDVAPCEYHDKCSPVCNNPCPDGTCLSTEVCILGQCSNPCDLVQCEPFQTCIDGHCIDHDCPCTPATAPLPAK